MNIKSKIFVTLQYLLPQHCISRLLGYLAECRAPWFKNALIGWFAKKYNVDMGIAQQPNLQEYGCFNDFFTRAIRPEARPIDQASDSIVSPADGAISQIGAIKHGRVFQAKGHSYSLLELLGGDEHRAEAFRGGQFCTIYLSPRDYHRVHMPLSGTLREMVYVPGKLFSVNRTTAQNVPELFARNERVVCIFDTAAGPMAVVLVGAMVVASIETVWAGTVTPPQRRLLVQDYSEQARQPITIEKGMELGRFKLGSTAIILFAADASSWHNELKEDTGINMGASLGSINKANAS